MSGSWGPTGWGTGRWGASTGSTPHDIFVMAVDDEGKSAPAIVPAARNEQGAFCVFDREGKLSPVAGGRLWQSDMGAQVSDDEGKGTPNGLIRYPNDDFDRDDTAAGDIGPDWQEDPVAKLPGLKIDDEELELASDDFTANGGMIWQGNNGRGFGFNEYLPVPEGDTLEVSANVKWALQGGSNTNECTFRFQNHITFTSRTDQSLAGFANLIPIVGGSEQLVVGDEFGNTVFNGFTEKTGTGRFIVEVSEDLHRITFVADGVGTFVHNHDISGRGWGRFRWWDSHRLRMSFQDNGNGTTMHMNELRTAVGLAESSSSSGP